jgi:uncharacterized protein (DUF486 family)
MERAPIIAWTAGLLLLSNTFMTFAWYGHLKYFHDRPIIPVILLAWGIAFFEYCLAVPANRLGSSALSGFQLKILQEVVTIVVFIIFARLVLGESLRWNHIVSFALICAAACFAFAFPSPALRPAV